MLNSVFWKNDPKFIVMLYWHIMPIFKRLRIIYVNFSPFLFRLGSLLPACYEGFSRKMTAKKSKFREILYQRRLHYVKSYLLSYRAWKLIHKYAWLEMKRQKIHVTRILHQGCWSARRNHSCEIWDNYELTCDFIYSGWSLPFAIILDNAINTAKLWRAAFDL